MFSLFVSSGNQQTEDNGPLRIYHQLELQITLESPRQNTPQGEHKEELFYFMWIPTLKMPFPPGKIFCIFFFFFSVLQFDCLIVTVGNTVLWTELKLEANLNMHRGK